MEFTHVELEGSAMQEGITSHGGLGAASLGFTATAHAALKGGAAVRLSVTDKTLQGLTKDRSARPSGAKLELRSAGGNAKLTLDLGTMNSVIETKGSAVVLDKALALRMVYRQTDGATAECDLDASHDVDQSLRLGVTYGLHSRQTRVRAVLVSGDTKLEPEVNLATGGWVLKAKHALSARDSLSASLRSGGVPALAYTRVQNGVELTVGAPLRRDFAAYAGVTVTRSVAL